MQPDLPQVYTITSTKPGPTVAILGGVHGDEYEGVIAALWLAKFLQSNLVGGNVRISAPAHPAAWSATLRESPIDGKNLARVFPGSANGSATQIVADEITERVIRGADLLIDLHSAGTNFEMPFLCGYHGGTGKISDESQRFADIFGADFTWQHSGQPLPGRSLSVAFDLKIPSIYTEGRGGKSVRHSDLQGYIDGVQRVLHELGMVTSAPISRVASCQVIGEGNTDAGITAQIAGYIVTRAECGQRVSRQEIIADIIDVNGDLLSQIDAPHDGFIMMRRRDARIEVGDNLFIFAMKDVRS